MLPSLQVIHDVNCLVSELCGDYVGHISHYLSSCSSEVLDVARKSMLQGGESLENVLPLITETIIEVIVDKSVEVKSYPYALEDLFDCLSEHLQEQC